MHSNISDIITVFTKVFNTVLLKCSLQFFNVQEEQDI